MKKLLIICLVVLLPSWVSARVDGRAVIVALGQIKLAENEPYVWGKNDCSSNAQELLKAALPDLVEAWFKRSRAEDMASWPFEVTTKDLITLGDLVFASKRPSTEKIVHVMVGWLVKQTVIHASSSRGFIKSHLKNYWWPRIRKVLRPPYGNDDDTWQVVEE